MIDLIENPSTVYLISEATGSVNQGRRITGWGSHLAPGTTTAGGASRSTHCFVSQSGTFLTTRRWRMCTSPHGWPSLGQQPPPNNPSREQRGRQYSSHLTLYTFLVCFLVSITQILPEGHGLSVQPPPARIRSEAGATSQFGAPETGVRMISCACKTEWVREIAAEVNTAADNHFMCLILSFTIMG